MSAECTVLTMTVGKRSSVFETQRQSKPALQSVNKGSVKLLLTDTTDKKITQTLL